MHTLFGTARVQTWGLQGKCYKLFSVLFSCIYKKCVSVKNSSAEGNCIILKGDIEVGMPVHCE